jgi:hypothetical protein
LQNSRLGGRRLTRFQWQIGETYARQNRDGGYLTRLQIKESAQRIIEIVNCNCKIPLWVGDGLHAYSGELVRLRGFIYGTGTQGDENFISKGKCSENISLRKKECSIFSIFSISMA